MGINDQTGASPPPQPAAARRAGVLAAAVAGAALLIAACGGAPAALPSGPSTYQQMASYAQCMQTHGAPTFPDPVTQPGGTVSFPGQPPAGPGLTQAQGACKKLKPTSGGQTAASQQEFMNQLLKLSACMRAHGIAGFPDPIRSGFGASIELPDGMMKSPQFKAAQKTCSSLLPLGPQGRRRA